MSAYEFEKKLIAVLKSNRHRYLDEESLKRELSLAESEDPGEQCEKDVVRTIEPQASASQFQ
jgi:hypothetical protein